MLELGQVEIDAETLRVQASRMVERVQAEVDECAGYGLARDGCVLLGQVPATRLTLGAGTQELVAALAEPAVQLRDERERTVAKISAKRSSAGGVAATVTSDSPCGNVA